MFSVFIIFVTIGVCSSLIGLLADFGYFNYVLTLNSSKAKAILNPELNRA